MNRGGDSGEQENTRRNVENQRLRKIAGVRDTDVVRHQCLPRGVQESGLDERAS